MISRFNRVMKNDRFFHKLIRGKKVAFVGPAPYLIGSGDGEKIDSYDTIIRTNGFCPVPSNLHGDYGSRCDILYLNVQYGKKILARKKGFDAQVKLLVFKDSSQAARAKSLKRKIPSRRINPRLLSAMRNKIGAWPLTGSLVLLDLIKASPKVLYLTGFDFYKGKKAWVKGYNPPTKKPYHKHKPNRDLLFFRDLYSSGNFIADEVLSKILISDI